LRVRLAHDFTECGAPVALHRGRPRSPADSGTRAELWQRLLRRPASESGRLCQGDGAPRTGRALPEGANVGYPLPIPIDSTLSAQTIATWRSDSASTFASGRPLRAWRARLPWARCFAGCRPSPCRPLHWNGWRRPTCGGSRVCPFHSESTRVSCSAGQWSLSPHRLPQGRRSRSGRPVWSRGSVSTSRLAQSR
jgi:hypothetical protein